MNSDQSIELTPELFKAALKTAGDSPHLDTETANLLRDAHDRLVACPDLLIGNQIGGFTYNDPVLEQAVYAVRLLWESHAELLVAGTRPGEGLVNSAGRIGQWIAASFRAFRYHHDASLLELAQRVPDRGVVFDKAAVRFAVVGDAGFKGIAQTRVLQMILSRHQECPFDAVIHLGDIYLAGNVRETVTHFLEPFLKCEKAGAKVFSLVGNHDLYCGAEGFDHILTVR